MQVTVVCSQYAFIPEQPRKDKQQPEQATKKNDSKGVQTLSENANNNGINGTTDGDQNGQTGSSKHTMLELHY